MTAREFVRQHNFGAGLEPDEVLRYIEAEMIEARLEAHQGNLCAVAREWHMHRNTLTRHIRELADLKIITRPIRERKRWHRRQSKLAFGETKAERLARVGREIRPPRHGSAR